MCRADLLHQRRCVGQRRREGLVDNEIKSDILEQMLSHRFDRGDRRRSVVRNDRNALGIGAGGFCDLEKYRKRLVRLRTRSGRGLEDVLEAAGGYQVRIRQRQHGQVRSLGDFARRQRQRAQIRSADRHHVWIFRHHALGRAFRLFGGVAAIQNDQLELGAAERLDAAFGIDALDRHLGTHAR